VPQILLVNPLLPARALKEFIAVAKAKPGQINYASAGNGSSTHLAMELLGIDPLGTSPEEFGKNLRADIARSSEMVRKRGIRAE
jgi:tripartite-type tricarboxylate transporter receptor subunit TctC